MDILEIQSHIDGRLLHLMKLEQKCKEERKDSKHPDRISTYEFNVLARIEELQLMQLLIAQRNHQYE